MVGVEQNLKECSLHNDLLLSTKFQALQDFSENVHNDSEINESETDTVRNKLAKFSQNVSKTGNSLMNLLIWSTIIIYCALSGSFQ